MPVFIWRSIACHELTQKTQLNKNSFLSGLKVPCLEELDKCVLKSQVLLQV